MLQNGLYIWNNHKHDGYLSHYPLSERQPEQWDRTQIIIGNGSIEAKDQHIQSVVGNEFTAILKTAQAASESMSQKQKERIVENLKSMADNVKDYPIFQDWLSDRNIQKDIEPR